MPHRPLALLIGLLASLGATALGAQDVELLGRVHGTRPPEGYYARRAADPDAFEFGRALRRRTAAVRPGGGRLEAALTPLGPREARVRGVFTFPVILGLFSDTQGQGPFAPADIQAAFFDGPNPTGTITELYREMSGGLVEVRGRTLPWQRSALTQAQVAGNSSGLGFGARVGSFIADVVAALDAGGSVDWGAFDNDGPDGVPNSGDDDGFVDVLTVMHPTAGAECSGNERSDRVWSHRWTLTAWGVGPVVTSTPSASGGSIRVDDYTIQPVLDCEGTGLNQIGVYAHELGHGFGLPDLYAVGGLGHAGIGQWGLMGSGAWGCPGPYNPARPCHMSAWSKVVLGWIDPEEVPLGADLGTRSLPPVVTSRTVLRVPSGDGSGTYLLLENRQPVGFDDNLTGGGLLVWEIDPTEVAARWATNTVNTFADRPGVRLLEADGRNDLLRPNGGRGDAGDPWPGSELRTGLHAGSTPATRTRGGEPMGITLLDIEEAGSVVRFRLYTRYQTVRLRTEGASGGAGLVRVDGAQAAVGPVTVRSAPFQTHAFEAAPGEPLAPGVRTGFQGWDDGAARVRSFVTGLADTVLTARYGGTEYEVAITEVSAQPSVDPAELRIVPGTADGWAAAGSEVSIEALPRTGFTFREWGGALAGSPNPLLRRMDAPLAAEAFFDVTFAAADPGAPVALTAARSAEVRVEVANGNLPVTWSLVTGALPTGLVLDPAGALRGAPLATGRFPVVLRVRDAIGLEGTLALELDVGAPVLGLSLLAAPFLGSGTGPDALEAAFLDRVGNRNGAYDLGDLRAWVGAHPELPLTSEERALVRVLGGTVTLPGGSR